jgi:uncharacterized spore protein YtfJ
MKPSEIIDQFENAVNMKRVFGEPYEKDGITFIPAAKVWLGAGGGEGEEESGARGQGSGGGFGVIAHPVGAFVIKGDDVTWKPTVDVNRAVLGGQIVAVIAFLTLRAVVRSLARRR